MTKTPYIMEEYDEAKILEGLHEATLSENKVVAATARMLKEVMPGLYRAVNAESKSINSPERCMDSLVAASVMARNVLLNALTNLGPIDAVATVIDDIADDFSEKLKSDFKIAHEAHKKREQGN